MRIIGKRSDRVLLFDFREETADMDVPEEDKPTRKKPKEEDKVLSPKEKRFCQRYVETSNAGQSVMDAGYNCSNLNSARVQATDLLKSPKIRREIDRLMKPGERKAIATAQQVMEFFTRIMNGEEKDQFGLEISANDRLKAAMELAKRTVDLDNKIKMAQQGVPDTTLTVKLDWQQS